MFQTKKFGGIDKKSKQAILQSARSLARDAAKHNLPAADTHYPCDDGRALWNQVSALKAHIAQGFHEELASTNADLARLIGRLYGEEVNACPALARQERDAAMKEFEGHLTGAAKDEDRWHRARKAVESEYGHVSAEDMGCFRLLLAGVTLALMIEAAINSLILGQVNPLGIIGGAVEALGIAALSVVLSYTWGVVLGHSFKYGWLGRSLGVLGTLVYAMLLIGYHTVIAWYREVLAHGDNPEAAVSTALGFCLEYGWAGLQDLHTWGLLVVGAFCGGLACGCRIQEP